MPANPFWSHDSDAAAAAVAALVAWRAELAAWLAGAERDDALSPALATVLLELVRARPSEEFRRFAYRLERMPSPEPPTDPCECLQSLLLWRAGVVDFLSDVWDTLGPAPFDIEECQRAGSLFTPIDSDGGGLCHLCLEPFAGAPSIEHFERCAVQRAWRDDGSASPRA